MNRIIILSMFVVILGLISSNVTSSKLEDGFVVVEDVEKAREDIENKGGIVRHIFPKEKVLIGEFPSNLKSEYIINEYKEDSNVPSELEPVFHSWKNLLEYKRMPLDEKLAKIPENNPSFNYKDLIIEERDDNFKDSLNVIPEKAPMGAEPTDTSLFFIGDISVTIIFPESNETVCTDPPSCTNYGSDSEDWTQEEINNVKSEVTLAMDWWSLKETNAHLTFNYNYKEQVNTELEPINTWGASSNTGRCLWINDVLLSLGYGPENNDCTPLVYDYTNDQRDNKNTDWGFVIFVVDSSNDIDGTFPDGSFAFAIADIFGGGPYFVMTYDNGNFQIGNMDAVAAHETGHMFGALDQYPPCNCNDAVGYLFVENQNCQNSCILNQGSIMRGGIPPYTNGLVDIYARGQIGWNDSDSDGVLDIEDMEPSITLNPYSPNPTINTNLSYNGNATVNIFPTLNPFYNDASINFVQNVRYRINNGAWLNTNPSDGTFNDFSEIYDFLTGTLVWGNYEIETKAINDRNIETDFINYGRDNVSVVGCTDSDNGINLNEKGTVNNFDGVIFGNEVDVCVNVKKVREYYCNSYNIESQESLCQYGCFEGRCLDKIIAPKIKFRDEPI